MSQEAPKRQVTFKRNAECLLFSREQSFDTFPSDGGVAIGLGTLVSSVEEPLNTSYLDQDDCKRYPARKLHNRLFSLSAERRDVSFNFLRDLMSR